MSVNYDSYKSKAIEACRHVFTNEYNSSLGIPIPAIDFVLPDSSHYESGEYFIKIGDSWQIHLNFGLLPVSYKDFQEEVKVLTRHEVEHYICCPFDVLTHFRMLNAIIKTYINNYTKHQIDIISLAGNIANQAADIIIDTKNFNIHKEETLKSEIAWIKKGGTGKFSDLPRHSKLMFLTKQALWKESLVLNETDSELLEEVDLLSAKFEDGGITNKSLFLEKTIEYTHSFFKLYQQDIQEKQQQSTNNNNSLNSSQSSYSGKPQITPSKDSQEGGSQFLFQSPDKIKEALQQLAEETSIEQFSQVVSAAGISSLSEKDKQKIWFEAQNADVIPILEKSPIGIDDNYSYPTTWKLGDPIEELDMMLSFTMSPIIIPGITTKKWVKNTSKYKGIENNEADLLLVIDTSGSMGSINEPSNNLHQAVIAAYGIIKFFESKSAKVALIGFSEKISACVYWTNDYDQIRETLLFNGGGGTNFPILNIEDMIEKVRNPVVTVVITDGEITNLQQTLNFFKEYLADGNRLFIFLQDNKSTTENYRELSNYGAKVAKTMTADEIRNTVLNDLI